MMLFLPTSSAAPSQLSVTEPDWGGMMRAAVLLLEQNKWAVLTQPEGWSALRYSELRVTSTEG